MPAKGHAPVLSKDRLLQAAAGPAVERLDARMADPERPTRRVEVPLRRMTRAQGRWSFVGRLRTDFLGEIRCQAERLKLLQEGGAAPNVRSGAFEELVKRQRATNAEDRSAD